MDKQTQDEGDLIEQAETVSDSPLVDQWEADLMVAFDAVEKADRQRLEAKCHVESAKGELKAAEEYFEGRVRELRDILRDKQRGQERLPFGDPASTDPEAWRAATLDELTIGGRESKALTEAGLTTLGDIANYTTEHSLADIPGIGQASALRIEEAIDDYWRLHPPAENGNGEEDQEADDAEQ